MILSGSSIPKPKNPKDSEFKENTAKWLIFKDAVPTKQKRLSLPNVNIIPRKLQTVHKEPFEEQQKQAMTFEEKKAQFKKEIVIIEKELKERMGKREPISRLNVICDSHNFTRSRSEPRYNLRQPSLIVESREMETIDEVDEEYEKNIELKEIENTELNSAETVSPRPNFNLKELISSTPKLQ